MYNFTFNIPTIVYFGKGQIKALEGELKKRAKKVLVVTGGGPEVFWQVTKFQPK